MRTLATTSLALLLTGVALAQQQPAAQPVRPGVTTQPGQPAAQPVRPGATTQPGQPATTLPPTIGSPLFQNNDVRRELNITEQQFGKLTDSFGRLRTRFEGDLGKLNQLDQQARNARVQELHQGFTSEFQRSAAEVLNPQQMGRFGQLELQRRGFDAFTDADVRQRLTLTDGQRQQLLSLGEENRLRQEQIQQLGATNREQALQQYNDFRRQSLEKTNTILNAEQQRAWGQMIGKPFNFQPSLPPPGQPLPRR